MINSWLGPQLCAAVTCVTVLFTPALSNAQYCCARDSYRTPQARLPRLHGEFEPVLPVYITTHVAGLPDYNKIRDDVYTMRSCVHHSSFMECSKSSPQCSILYIDGSEEGVYAFVTTRAVVAIIL